MKGLKAAEMSPALERSRLRVRIGAQALEPLPKGIDLRCRSLLRGSFPILGKFGASKRRIALSDELDDLGGRRRRINRRRGGGGPSRAIHAIVLARILKRAHRCSRTTTPLGAR